MPRARSPSFFPHPAFVYHTTYILPPSLPPPFLTSA